MRRSLIVVVFVSLCLSLSTPATAQQTEVNRFDLFTGYSHLSSPSVSLQQNGFNTSFGVNVRRWVALGGDFSVFTGNGSINFADTKIASQIAAIVPPGLTVPPIPFSATTYTFAAGPQFNYRHFEKVTFFARPGLGGLHERAQLHVPASLLPLLPLIPGLSTKLTDTVVFYGFGGGVDLNASKHVGVRFSVDFVHTSLFSNLLNSRNAVRFSVGPTWKWGELK
jgi:Outer membrane protein beta-barrel domain